jgi:mannose/fructose/N-acetylgalactosamine-specific phosphotransferase system component IID
MILIWIRENESTMATTLSIDGMSNIIFESIIRVISAIMSWYSKSYVWSSSCNIIGDLKARTASLFNSTHGICSMWIICALTKFDISNKIIIYNNIE